MNGQRPLPLVTRALEAALGGGAAAEEVAGDLHEEFLTVRARRGRAVAHGWYAAQALRLTVGGLAARWRRGRPAAVSVTLTSQRGDPFMRTIAADFRYAFRSLRRRPALSAVIVLTMALGLGANATIFQTIDALVLRPFTLPDLDRLVLVGQTAEGTPAARTRQTVAPANFLDWRSSAGTLEALAAFDHWDVNLAAGNEAELVQGFLVSPAFFSIAGVQPALGRGFTSDEETPGRHRRAVISDGLWKRRFGGDSAVLGRTLLLDAEPYEVVGVMPDGFNFPTGADVWAPLAFDAETATRRNARYLSVVGKLAPGRTRADAHAEMQVIASRLAQQYPEANRGRGAQVVTVLAGMRDEGLGPILGLWQAAAAFVLLIACANIANLLLARGAERQRELAVRAALGASRARVIRSLLAESLVLGAAAVPAALAFAWVGVTLIRVNLPPRLVRFIDGWQQLDVDARLVLFTAALAIAAAIAFALVPAVHVSRPALGETLKEGGRTVSHGRGRQRLRRTLVIGEVALALPLLVASGLAAIGTDRFLRGSQGYDPRQVLTMRAVLPDAKYTDVELRRQFVAQVLERLSRLPGVEQAAVANAIPSGGSTASRPIEIEGRPNPDPANPPMVDYRAVTPAFFDTLRIPVLRGRQLSAGDVADGQPVIVVSESLAARYFPGEDPIGRRLRFGSGPWQTIVGVSGDVIQDWFNRRNYPTVYRPYVQAPTVNLAFAVRASGDLAALGREAAAVVRSVDAAQPVFMVLSMERLLNERTLGLQYISVIMGVFGALALLLAVVGVYSLMAYMVTQRTHEIGVRMALGASRASVLRLTVGQAARLTSWGVAIGLVLSIALGRFVEAGLVGVASNNIRVSLAFAAVLIAAALAAGYLPARRASSIDPVVALRSE